MVDLCWLLRMLDMEQDAHPAPRMSRVAGWWTVVLVNHGDAPLIANDAIAA
jgi:hypothetical protein